MKDTITLWNPNGTSRELTNDEFMELHREYARRDPDAWTGRLRSAGRDQTGLPAHMKKTCRHCNEVHTRDGYVCDAMLIKIRAIRDASDNFLNEVKAQISEDATLASNVLWIKLLTRLKWAAIEAAVGIQVSGNSSEGSSWSSSDKVISLT